jgi:hypothetical protein
VTWLSAEADIAFLDRAAGSKKSIPSDQQLLGPRRRLDDREVARWMGEPAHTVPAARSRPGASHVRREAGEGGESIGSGLPAADGSARVRFPAVKRLFEEARTRSHALWSKATPTMVRLE